MATASGNALVALILMLILPIGSEHAQGGGGAGGAGGAAAGAAGGGGGAAAGAAGGAATGAGAAGAGVAGGAAHGTVGTPLGGGSGGGQVVVPRGVVPNGSPGPVTPNLNADTVLPNGSAPTAGVPDGHTVIVNPSQIAPSALGRALGDGSPNANLPVPRGSIPITGVTGVTGVGVTGGTKSNVPGNSALDNASGIIPTSRGTSGGDVGQSRTGERSGAGNISGVVPAARVPAAGGPAPGGNASASGGNRDGPGATLNSPSPPPAIGQSAPVAPTAVQGISSQVFSQTGLSRPGEDGVSTKIVAAKPCTSAARETDGTTTCVGIPKGK